MVLEPARLQEVQSQQTTIMTGVMILDKRNGTTMLTEGKWWRRCHRASVNYLTMEAIHS